MFLVTVGCGRAGGAPLRCSGSSGRTARPAQMYRIVKLEYFAFTLVYELTAATIILKEISVKFLFLKVICN